MARQVFDLCFSGGRLDAARVNAATDAIINDRPRHYLQVLKELARLIRLELEKRHAIVESAAELDSESVSRIESSLRSRFGGDITTEFKVTPQLIGGMRIQLGSDVWDGSVRSKLQQLQQQL